MRNVDAIAALEEKNRREARERAEKEAETARLMRPPPTPPPPEKITLSVAIMAHPSRRAWVEEILERTGLGEDRVAWDTDGIRWHTGRRAWELIDPDASHGVVLQDDVLPCLDLIPGMEKALEYVPPRTSVSLFYGAPREIPSAAERRWAPDRVRTAQRAIEERASWVVLPSLTWGPAFVVPTDVIPSMLEWCDTRTYPEYDKRVGRYVVDILHWPCWHPWPSPVEHRGTESLCDHGHCYAYQFLGADVSALEVDWSGPVIWHEHVRWRE